MGNVPHGVEVLVSVCHPVLRCTASLHTLERGSPNRTFIRIGLLRNTLGRWSHVHIVVGGGRPSELEAEAKADLKVRLCTGPECPERGVHNVAPVKNYRISEVHSKDHSFCDAAFGNRADIQDGVV